MFTPEQQAQYVALNQHCGYVPLVRSLVAMTGRDRATILHKFCTQDVLSLQSGQGGEAFICTVQGKILGYVYFFVGETELVLDSAPGQAEVLIQHLDRYVIREDVQFENRSVSHVDVLVAGPSAGPMLESLTNNPSPAAMYAHVQATLAGNTVSLRQVPYLQVPSYFVTTRMDDLSEVLTALALAGATPCEPIVADAARIEAGTPLYGVDISQENLPQEVARDAEAIHFKKGCYLGQETVARIDALGHVNKLLVQVAIPTNTEIPAGTELLAGDKVVGRVTSSAWSPTQASVLALAYLRREHAKPGKQLSSILGDAFVVE